jgi:hypothetical protein
MLGSHRAAPALAQALEKLRGDSQWEWRGTSLGAAWANQVSPYSSQVTTHMSHQDCSPICFQSTNIAVRHPMRTAVTGNHTGMESGRVALWALGPQPPMLVTCAFVCASSDHR